MRIFNKFAPRITSTASATTFYPYISMCANCDFCENIAWVFWVNRVFGVFLIYPIYPKNPKYYLFVFSSPVKRPIRITDSFSFDYADSPYHLITLSHYSHGLSANTFQPSSKVRRNSFQNPISLKISTRFLFTQHGGSGACGGSFSVIPPPVHFLPRKRCFFCSNTCVYAFFIVPLRPKWWPNSHLNANICQNLYPL